MASYYDNLKTLHDNFLKSTKRVLKKDISKKLDTLKTQQTEITNHYNDYILFATNIWIKLNNADKGFLEQQIKFIREKLVRCYERLKSDYILPNELLSLIDLNDISDPTVLNDVSPENLDNSKDFEDNLEDLDNLFQQEVTMTDLTNVDFLKLAANTIPKNFSGNPLALQSFLDSISLLESLATSANLKTLLVTFLLTRLEGRARESISGTPTNVVQITSALKDKIKPENSKVIEGRLRALKTDRVSLNDFTEKANELAESFRRALVIEGIPSTKADEMTVEKTIELCRSNARSDLVKSVLASSSFTDHKEVVAKFIVEINNETKEKQVLAFGSKPNFGRNKNFNKNGYNNNNNRGNKGGNRGRYRGRFHGRNFGNGYNSRNNNGNNGNGGNARFNSNGNNYNGNNNRNGRGNRDGSDGRNVRYSENSDAPQWRLGVSNSDVNDQQLQMNRN